VAAVDCPKDERMIDAVYPASELHDNVLTAVYLAHSALRSFERSERMIDRTVSGIISRGRYCNRNY
jgi:hypothetical protein